MKRVALVAIVCACGSSHVSRESSQVPPHHEDAHAVVPGRPAGRMLPPEAFLRAYLTWFGGLAPLDVQRRAHGFDLFDTWSDYVAALGLPDYRVDFPRMTQSNTMMLATVGRLGEALCVRAVEHDLRSRAPLDQRVVFAFEPMQAPSLDEFASRFDVLHRTFLGYPADLAPPDRIGRFYALYQQVVAYHDGPSGHLTPQESAWAAVCAALVMHPEAQIY